MYGRGGGGVINVNPDYITIVVIRDITYHMGFSGGSLTDELLMWWFCKGSSWYTGVEDLTIMNQ